MITAHMKGAIEYARGRQGMILIESLTGMCCDAISQCLINNRYRHDDDREYDNRRRVEFVERDDR